MATERTAYELHREIVALKESIHVEFAYRDKALQMQATEYERRLEILNHENQRILDAGALAVSNEKFDGFVKSFEQWKRSVDQDLSTAQGTAFGRSSLRAKTIANISIVLAVVGGVIVLFQFFANR